MEKKGSGGEGRVLEKDAGEGIRRGKAAWGRPRRGKDARTAIAGSRDPRGGEHGSRNMAPGSRDMAAGTRRSKEYNHAEDGSHC